MGDRQIPYRLESVISRSGGTKPRTNPVAHYAGWTLSEPMDAESAARFMRAYPEANMPQWLRWVDELDRDYWHALALAMGYAQ